VSKSITSSVDPGGLHTRFSIEKSQEKTRERKLRKLLLILSLGQYNRGGWSGVEQPLRHHFITVPEFFMYQGGGC